MLQYLINITDNTFVPVIMFALLSAAFVQTSKKYLVTGFVLGMMAALVYAFVNFMILV